MSDLYHRAVQATRQQEADALFQLCVQACERQGRTRMEQIARDYIGYFAASYCDETTRQRAYQLYATENPLDRYYRYAKSPAPAALGAT
jgi:hypothetical protein